MSSRNLAELMREAEQSAKNTGHDKIKWEPPHVGWNKGDSCNGYCLRCHCWVRVDTNPPPNGVDISGSVFSNHCPSNPAMEG